MDIGDEIRNEFINFLSRKTIVNFIFLKFGEGEFYQEIKCEWLNSLIKIENKNKFYCEIENNEQFDELNYYI